MTYNTSSMENAEIDKRFDRILTVLDKVTDSIAGHYQQIDELIVVAERHHQELRELGKQWQAYLTTIHSRH